MAIDTTANKDFQSDAEALEWLERMKQYADSAAIRQPGTWLEADLSSDEQKQCFDYLEERQRAANAGISIEDQTKAIMPFFNAFMHLFYKNLQKGDTFDLSTDENGVYFDGKPVDFVAVVLALVQDEKVYKSQDDADTGKLAIYAPLFNDPAINPLHWLRMDSFNYDQNTGTAKYEYKTKSQEVKITCNAYPTYIKKSKRGGQEVEVVGNIPASAITLFDEVAKDFTISNLGIAKKKGTAKELHVRIPLTEYADRAKTYSLMPQIMGTKEEQKKENNRISALKRELKAELKRDLESLTSFRWTITTIEGEDAGDFKNMVLFQDSGVNKGFLELTFGEKIADYLIKSNKIMQYPDCLPKDSRNPNAQRVGHRIALHASTNNNGTFRNNITLSVESLLSSTPDIMTFEKMRERGQNDWKRLIKRPLELAINANVESGFIVSWVYRNAKTKQLYTPDGANSLKWSDFYKLRVDFILIPNTYQIEQAQKKADQRVDNPEAASDPPKKKRGRPRKNTPKK